MRITRRRLLSFAAVAASTWSLPVGAANGENAVCWRVTAPSKKSNVLFGYMRISASLVPEIVGKGRKLIDETQAFVMDVPDIRMRPPDLMRKDVTPILRTLSKPVADELRSSLAEFSDSGVPVEVLSGLEVSIFLVGEGGSWRAPYVGRVLADHARTLGRPFAVLINEKELRQELYRTPDLVVLNRSIGEPEIAFLLDLRRRVGPIGAHLHQLYRARRGAEVVQLTATLRRRGLLTSMDLVDEARYRHMLLGRLTTFLALADAPIFVALPIDVLPGLGGMLALLRARGSTLTPIF